MKLCSYGWFDQGLVGYAKVLCDCGCTFEVEFISADPNNLIECSKCHKKERLRYKLDFWFEAE